MMHALRNFMIAGAVLSLFLPLFASAQSQEGATSTSDNETVEEAQVTGVSAGPSEILPDTGVSTPTQTVTAYILSGPDAGEDVTFQNDFIQLQSGETFYAMHTTNPLDGTNDWNVADAYRLNALEALGAIFLFLVIVFGGLPGLRGVASLAGSLLLIFLVLIPGILHGYSPIVVSIGVSGLIIIAGSYITHGFNRTTNAAVLGMVATLLVTGALAYYFVSAAHLSGLATEEEATLNFDAQSMIDMAGLLFGGIVIGLLGILYDIAIGQAIAVEELFRAGAQMTRLQVYTRAIRIGREHIGALVNTLAIAYVGSALPLILLAQESASFGFLYSINSELFATEIVRILVGSIGLILSVPVTTLIASYMLHGRVGTGSSTHGPHVHAH